MANKPKSLYLTERTMSALRGDEALSGRINQIVDRYLQAIEAEAQAVRARFRRDDWDALVSLVPKIRGLPPVPVANLQSTLAVLTGQRSCVGRMKTSKFVVLLELIERDHAQHALDPHP